MELTKNTILRWSNRKVQSPEAALEEQSSSMQVHSYNNTMGGERYSAAEDCRKILEQGSLSMER